MKKILLFYFLFTFIPFITITLLLKEEAIKENKFKFSENTMVRVYRTKTGKIDVVPLEEYVMGVVAGEMPVSFKEEALKAQAVAARSYIMYKILKNNNKNYDVVDTVLNQVYIDDMTLKKKWKNNYVKYKNKIEQAVKDTSYQYITYNGKIAEALFFSTSSGYTENSEDVFSSKVHYLKSVKSDWDKISPVFSEKELYTISDFCKKLHISCGSKPIVKILTKTSNGRINKLSVNNKVFTGNDFVKLLGLRTTNFVIDIDKEVTITTRGYGHGVGMSQYGAEGMARAGYKYDEILKYYYTDIKIEKIKTPTN